MKKLLVWLFLLGLCSFPIFAEDNENSSSALTLTPVLDQTLYLNTKYTSLFKLEISDKKPCSSQDTVTVFYNITKSDFLIKEDIFSKEIGCTSSASTGEFTPAETGNYVLCGQVTNSSVSFSSNVSCLEFAVADTSNLSCDVNLYLKANETIFYENGQSINFKPQLNDKTYPFVIEYWIEDLFGNIVKPKINTTNTDQKSWKASIKEEDRVLFLKAAVYPSCADADLYDNMAEYMFIVTKKEALTTLEPGSSPGPEHITESIIKIIKTSPIPASFGNILNAELEIYKGNTGKYSVSVWAEKNEKVISEKTKIQVKNKDTEYKFSVPVLLDANCDGKIKDGDAQLVVEGLGLREEHEFKVEEADKKPCPEPATEASPKKPEEKETVSAEKTKTSNQSLSLFSQQEDFPQLLEAHKVSQKEISGYRGIVIYESVSEQSKKIISWALLFALGLLCLVLALKKSLD